MCDVLECKEDSPLYQLLISNEEPRLFQKDFAIIYRGQVPNVCFLLVSGDAFLGRGPAPLRPHAPALIGFTRLFQNHPTSQDVTIAKGAYASIFDRQQILTLLATHKNLFPDIYQVSG